MHVGVRDVRRGLVLLFHLLQDQRAGNQVLGGAHIRIFIGGQQLKRFKPLLFFYVALQEHVSIHNSHHAIQHGRFFLGSIGRVLLRVSGLLRLIGGGVALRGGDVCLGILLHGRCVLRGRRRRQAAEKAERIQGAHQKACPMLKKKLKWLASPTEGGVG